MGRVRRDGEDSDSGMFAEVTKGTVDGDPVVEVTRRSGRENKWKSGWFAPDTARGHRAAEKLEDGAPFVPDEDSGSKWRGRERG